MVQRLFALRLCYNLWSERRSSKWMTFQQNQLFWIVQCDQMIWANLLAKAFSILPKLFTQLFQKLPNSKTLPKWPNFALSGHTGIPWKNFPLRIVLSQELLKLIFSSSVMHFYVATFIWAPHLLYKCLLIKTTFYLVSKIIQDSILVGT